MVDKRPLKMVRIFVWKNPDEVVRKGHGVGTKKRCEFCEETTQPQLYSYGNDK